MDGLRMISYNSTGLSDSKIEYIQELISNIDADIIVTRNMVSAR